MSFSWNCPFCNHHATIDVKNAGSSRYEFNFNNKYGYQAAITHVVACPNPECREYTLTVTLHDNVEASSDQWKDLKAKKTWSLIPQASVKVFPDYVPEAIISDYEEACLIRDLSPKASATLSRRCIQGIIRDFWVVKKGRLVDEIEALQEKVDPVTWAAIDAVRKIGNIGAHMEKDINLIVNVDPREAGLLIGLIENLINDWYVVREERKKRMEDIVSVAQEKAEIKNGSNA
ncbi:MAG: hypothetical protein COW19_03200 [Zetaproteobacteria bacterium CG12_big_fil_rev_8_21_14_0_65_55_1124]|nr:MAG: hypothetical protein AUJ58_00215 [Zetaproteobacteria bacterium CG1_02_55_237]PIS20199.1 MAG: hypothetical protein COT53_01595 [Zetaproteobacteria bacterium CG08_land_8_20_14_0_20_55_17]PIW43356.1 MAG: hypothetical protein COW19_03200 [Zetaproteobacteria bacterium CG12_big_fil_rev_8_21_14_0_65_55_1124]PIY53063.1 MAG: hypothetical protein COZ01_05105 [Zetaproteobacteria bacterium CG_4_10_14_0_8_um_filter_55_43]PIZ39972.1 MAG: hypothetical protein COY36_01055 [Zetaproteobacteria bacterium 